MMEIKGAVSLKVLAEAKAEGVQKSTQFRVDPKIIEIEDGFNARPIDYEHVSAMKTSMLAGSILPPLFVRVENDRIIMVDGHHRLTAILQLIDEGHEIKRVDIMQFRGNDADRISHMLTSAQGKALTPLQMGIQYRKLEAFGWDQGEIAKKVGKSRQHVHDMVLLAESNSDVQGMVARGEVAAHVAIDVLRKHGSEAGSVLAGHLDTAKAAGKNKVTNKTIRKAAPEADAAAEYLGHLTLKALLFDAIENAARDLPEGWSITLGIEKGSAWVEVNNPEDDCTSIDPCDRSLAEQLNGAVAMAAELA
ncbi:MAG: ParB N-terminal domain-containing protein [Desulfobulbaceae bacterium]|nr:ParB N-terminal domain-containing protein [Desulfobulbaceae bacterium]